MQDHKVVSRKEWLVARKEHLAREKEFTRLRDQLSRQRRELPWVKVDKEYIFNGPNGKESLGDLLSSCDVYGQCISAPTVYTGAPGKPDDFVMRAKGKLLNATYFLEDESGLRIQV